MMAPDRRVVVLGMLATGALPGVARAASNELIIQINLPLDRTKAGVLNLSDSDGNSILSGLEALGKSDNAKAASVGNDNRDPTLKFGDTPQGTFSVPRTIATG